MCCEYQTGLAERAGLRSASERVGTQDHASEWCGARCRVTTVALFRFVLNIVRTGRDVNVWSFQGCAPNAYLVVRVCIQMKQGFIFHWWKNLCVRNVVPQAQTRLRRAGVRD